MSKNRDRAYQEAIRHSKTPQVGEVWELNDYAVTLTNGNRVTAKVIGVDGNSICYKVVDADGISVECSVPVDGFLNVFQPKQNQTKHDNDERPTPQGVH